ncbi:GGDEF domain-containing protein [Aestuariicella hydrocarbonica]|uniref:diguanylate cyclase n=1 Tax=Pseudomaricurvus hydrocarbonicus TaxID=1470433 RepID=A0A9E5MKC4_9GAMM|nr:GGDEF domain-containing protein [Aestuariicella hydrocarbonica]NHO65197.1 GGDEF domain-containing protein [Aestuariicella hydrocarbonica]
MKNHVSLHFSKIVLLVGTCAAVLAGNMLLGEAKAWREITWIDIFGEGSTMGLMLMFLAFVLSSRPRGRVTNYLAFGLIGFSAATFQDVIDEIFILEPGLIFGDLVESVTAPIAVVILAYGLYLWNQEQVAINQRLQSKERFYREHSALDYVTDLYTALYMQKQVEREIVHYRNTQQPFSLLMLDISNFNSFNRHFGDQDGDRLLTQVAHMLTLNIRSVDLACRYAGDRFIVLFPQTHMIDARIYAEEILNALKNMAFKPENAARSVFIECNISLVDHSDGDHAQRLLGTLTQRLETDKFHKRTQATKTAA